VSFPSDQYASELLEVFFESAEEILQGMNRAGLALEENAGDGEQLRHVRRAVHTLKGDSAACGFRELSELAHRLEDVLTPELAGEKASEIADVVLSATDLFDSMLAAYRKNAQPPAGDVLRESIERLLAKPGLPPVDVDEPEWTEYERLAIGESCHRGESVYRVTLHLSPETPMAAVAFELVRKALDGSGKLLAMCPPQVEENIARVYAVVSSKESPDSIGQRCKIPAVVERLSVERIEAPPAGERDALQVLLEAESAAIAPRSGKPGDSLQDRRQQPRQGPGSAGVVHSAVESSLRVDTARIDSVMNLVGELIIGKSMLQRAISEFEHRHAKDPLRGKFTDALGFQSRVLGELQKSVMKIRMVPVEQLFRRFPRIVRDVARLRSKDIVLEMSGENTDLDKSILDALGESLAHLLRNAADHGIETPSERQKCGKPARGTIRLKAYHDGDQVVIEVSDDGRGLDREKILRRAAERGMITADESAQFSESETLELIFRPGFSTADQVTEISGRGVGLDVVKAVLENLKGSVEVATEAGRSTTFRLLVPLTLASIQALLFRVHGHLYAVPIASVVEIARLPSEEIHPVDGREVFRLRNQILTLIRLDGLCPPVARDPAKRIFVVVIGVGGRRVGVAVDSLMCEEELVIKPLEDQLSASPLVSGASILGDGTVVLILNVAAVISHLAKSAPRGATA
jgi:two-component system, chemotaxis family, sensor kinase CheA